MKRWLRNLSTVKKLHQRQLLRGIFEKGDENFKNTCRNAPQKSSSPITDDHDQSHWFIRKKWSRKARGGLSKCMFHKFWKNNICIDQMLPSISTQVWCSISNPPPHFTGSYYAIRSWPPLACAPPMSPPNIDNSFGSSAIESPSSGGAERFRLSTKRS